MQLDGRVTWLHPAVSRVVMRGPSPDEFSAGQWRFGRVYVSVQDEQAMPDIEESGSQRVLLRSSIALLAGCVGFWLIELSRVGAVAIASFCHKVNAVIHGTPISNVLMISPDLVRCALAIIIALCVYQVMAPEIRSASARDRNT